MGEDDTPNILKSRTRGKESRWQRFWRRRRMNAVRNSSDHAVFMAVGITTGLLVIGTALFLMTRGASFSGGGASGGYETPKAGFRQ
jgi:hypothetical protein